MHFDESARLSSAVAIILVAAFVATLVEDAPAAVFVIVTGLALLTLGYARWPKEPAMPMASEPQEEPFKQVLDGLADPILLLREARVIHANAAALKLFGDHVTGQDVRLAIRHPAIATMLADHDGRGVVEINGVGGPSRVWEIRIDPTVRQWRLVHMVDRSVRQAAERARVDFVANASHELRTPLANILGYVETLRDDKAADDVSTRERFLGIIGAEAKRMLHLVEELMSLSRIEAEKHEAPVQQIDLAQLVARVIAERRETIIYERDPELPPIKGDAAQISQLLHNLVDNAIKYGKRGGKVTVTLRQDGARWLRLAVIDEGEGIPASHIPRLTERFYRVDPGRSRSAGGTGLGLSIVKHIVEHHRAELKIESEIGRGTTVSVKFAAASASYVTKLSHK
jgi:two-component system, OmpR family, phosphate regulon sensor histidine kinase PhoR